MQSNQLGPEKTIIDMGASKDEKIFCRRHRRSRDENLENSLDEVDLQEKGFLLSPHTAQTDYWCSRSSRGVSGTADQITKTVKNRLISDI